MTIQGLGAGVKIVSGVKVAILILGILGSGSANAFAATGHVVDYRVNINLDVVIAAGLYHCFKFALGSQLRLKLVAHSLVANPPLLTLNVLLRRRDQNPVNTRVSKVLTLLCNGIEVPQKHLNSNLVLEPVRVGIRAATSKR